MSLQARGRRVIPEWKIRAVEETAELIKKYKIIGIGSLERLPTAQFQQIRKKLRGKVEFKVVKTSIARRALQKAGIDVEKLGDYLTGSIMLVLTNMNPFKLAKTLGELKVPVAAKPGQVTDKEIVVPAGDTGIKPGPQLSTFSKLRIPYQIKGGTVHITKDTVVAKPGDVISTDLAGFLLTMGILPFEVSVKLRAVYDNGVVIPGDQLKLDIDSLLKDITLAIRTALELGSEVAYPAPEILELSITKAFRRALMLAAETGFVTPETAEQVFSVAISRAMALATALGDTAKELGVDVAAIAPAAAPAAEEAKEEKPAEEEEEEEEEELTEEDLAAGLGALFG